MDRKEVGPNVQIPHNLSCVSGSPDNSSLLSIPHGSLVVNCSSRYPRWALFCSRHQRLWSRAKELARACGEMHPSLKESHWIELHFNPPAALHFGEVWGWEIRSVKSILLADVVEIIIIEVDYILKLKLLRYVSSDVADLVPITFSWGFLMASLLQWSAHSWNSWVGDDGGRARSWLMISTSQWKLWDTGFLVFQLCCHGDHQCRWVQQSSGGKDCGQGLHMPCCKAWTPWWHLCQLCREHFCYTTVGTAEIKFKIW